MIPIQTILALLAVLLMFGCSQQPPYKSTVRVDGQLGNGQSTGSPTPTATPGQPINKIDRDLNGVIKPARPDPEKTRLEIAIEHQAWKFKLTGPDADRLYRYTQIKSKRGHGSHDEEAFEKEARLYNCRHFESDKTECEWTIDSVSGEMPAYSEAKSLKGDPKYATDLPDHPIQDGMYLSFSQNTPDPKEPAKANPSPFFQIKLQYAFVNGNLEQSAKTLFETLGGAEEQKTDPATKKPYSRKHGKFVECRKDPASAEKDAYQCIWYGNLFSGDFETIVEN